MKIGIITWFHYENYGTKLQAYALYEYLINLGHEVQLVNFQLNDGTIKTGEKEKAPICERIIRYLGYNIYNYELKKYPDKFNLRSEQFEDFISNRCTLTKLIQSDKEYIEVCNRFDVLICGSDQIWNPYWYHPYYYADFEQIHTKRISYAPSIGVLKVPSSCKEKMKRSLSRFKAISLREESACKIISSIIGFSPKCVVDPTLLLDERTWDNLISNKITTKQYIACYFLTDNVRHWRAVKRFAKKIQLPLMVIPQQGISYLQSKCVDRAISVESFLGYIRNAQIVITDSFHACVFSIIFNRQFVVFERHNPSLNSSQNCRIYNLLRYIKYEELLLPYNSDSIGRIPSINYQEIHQRLDNRIEASKAFLVDAMEV